MLTPVQGEMFTGYLTGSNSTVSVQPIAMSKDIPWLNAVLGSMTLNSALEGYNRSPITAVTATYVGASLVFLLNARST